MGIFQALNVGIAGLQAQSNVIGVVSDNLANVNTVGFKRSIVNFRSLVSSDNAFNYSPNGPLASVRHLNQAQGDIAFTQSSTDLAISGNGYFAVRGEDPATGGIFYTRAGTFLPDLNGDLRNGAGYFLQGWLLDQNGDLPAGLAGNIVDGGTGAAGLVTVNPRAITLLPLATTLATLKVNLKSSQPSLANSTVSVAANLNAAQLPLPTGNITFSGNLNSAQAAFGGAYDPAVSATNMASGAVVPQFSRTMTVLDNEGTQHSVLAAFLKTGADTWSVEIYAQPPTDVTQADGLLSYGTVTFNADGSLASISPALTAPITADWNNPGGATMIDFNFGTVGALDGLTQLDSAFSSAYAAAADYDPTSLTLSMASGGVAPHYTTTVNVLDDTGVARTLNVSFLKTDIDTWAIEIYANPATDVTGGAVPGQVAYGTAKFTTAGSLASVSSSLINPIPVAWNGSGTLNNVNFQWSPSGVFNGLTQTANPFSSTLTPTHNYDPDLPALNMTSGNVPPHLDSTTTFVDPTGVEHTIHVAYLKTGTNTWSVEVYAAPATDLAAPTAQITSGILTFNGDGSLASISPSLSAPLTMTWANGETNTVTMNWGTLDASDGLKQLDSHYASTITQNGTGIGGLTDISITQDGYVVGVYNNGTSRRLYRIPLAIFPEQNELQSLTGGVFAITNESGTVTYAQANTGTGGKLIGGALEQSNVETGNQLVAMIIAQRAYQSNTKIISTTDEMLQSLTQAVG